jgi:hypothetical protein
VRRLNKILITSVVLGGVAFSSTACTPDTTRGRVEHDVPLTFANAFATSQQLQGKPVTKPDVTSTECHSSINLKEDSGPGSWDCEMKYTVDGKDTSVNVLVLVDSLGCYQAMDTDNRNAMILDKATDAKIPDPKVGFDGCYDVYDNRTNVSNQ